MSPVNDTRTKSNRLLSFPQKVCQLQITSAVPTVIMAAVLPHVGQTFDYRETTEDQDSKLKTPRNSNIVAEEPDINCSNLLLNQYDSNHHKIILTR
jgi:hypothetical protein